MIRPRPILTGLLALAAIGAGCESSFDRHRVELEALHERGQYQLAVQALDDANARGLYGQRSRILWFLERGAAALAAGNTAEAIEMLNAAEVETERFNERDASDVAGQWLLSERASKYIAHAYEQQYINVFKMLAHFMDERTENGPTVEARRMATKANALRDRSADLLDELESQTENTDIDFREPGEFIESPLGVYLSAVAFIEHGESDMASTAVRRLATAAQAQAGLGISSDTTYASELEGKAASEQDALFVALGGTGPALLREKVGPYYVYTTPIYFELPRIVPGGSRADRAIAEIEYEDGSTETVDLHFVENFSAVAEANFQNELPVVHARTYARALTKSGIFTAGSLVALNASDDPAIQAAGFLGSMLGGLAYLAVTEKADVRSWTLLPGLAWAGVMDLPQGTHRARVVFLDRFGSRLHEGPWEEVVGGRYGLSTNIEFWPG